MSRKRSMVVAAALAVLVVGLVGGGAVLAQSSGTEGDGPLQSFASRVASILGLGEQQVQEAIDQAKTEMRNEAVQVKLDALVASGRITQEQADEYALWYESMPDSIGPRFGGFGFGGRHGHGRGGHGLRGFFGGDSKSIEPAPAPAETTL